MSSAMAEVLAAGPGAMTYMSGFGNHHESEALPASLPVGCNTPQHCPRGLYAEQLSGSAFTCPRHANLRTWLYRKRPSVCHGPFARLPASAAAPCAAEAAVCTPGQLRWSPFAVPAAGAIDFVAGLALHSHAGDPASRHGLSIFIYGANAPMVRRAFCSSDGELLIVPQMGALAIQTEMGALTVAPNEICVVPRGVRFKVDPVGAATAIRGYILEVYNGRFELPDLGPIGANGLANPQDFFYPRAAYDADDGGAPWEVVNKYLGALYAAPQPHSPFDVVAWRGNYAPYKYDLARFAAVNAVCRDHMDPSIFTVLTCKSTTPGVAIADFVIFPPRWSVATDTFRPPYYHRNVMTEFMGLISGAYEAKGGDAFAPGGASLHSPCTPHGPDAAALARALAADTRGAERVADGTMSFMFESSLFLRTTHWAMVGCGVLQDDYAATAWGSIPCPFDASPA